jgi:hypothetical protein
MWYYTVNNQPVGPVDEDKLKQLLASQSINANTLVWKEGMAEWKPLGQTELAKLTGGVPMVPPVAPVYVPNPESLLKTQEAKNLFDLTRWYKFFGFPFIFFFFIYKGWEAVPENSRGLKPWKAIGQLFIPLFNLYWVFVAIKDLPKELNAYIQKNGVQTPLLSESMALWISILVILMVIPWLDFFVAIALWIIAIIFMNDLKKTLIAIAEAKAK